MEIEGQRFVVVVDAIVGQGCVYQQGHVLGAAELWGYAQYFVDQGVVRPLPQYAMELESVPSSFRLC